MCARLALAWRQLGGDEEWEAAVSRAGASGRRVPRCGDAASLHAAARPQAVLSSHATASRWIARPRPAASAAPAPRRKRCGARAEPRRRCPRPAAHLLADVQEAVAALRVDEGLDVHARRPRLGRKRLGRLRCRRGRAGGAGRGVWGWAAAGGRRAGARRGARRRRGAPQQQLPTCWQVPPASAPRPPIPSQVQKPLAAAGTAGTAAALPAHCPPTSGSENPFMPSSSPWCMRVGQASFSGCAGTVRAAWAASRGGQGGRGMPAPAGGSSQSGSSAALAHAVGPARGTRHAAQRQHRPPARPPRPPGRSRGPGCRRTRRRRPGLRAARPPASARRPCCAQWSGGVAACGLWCCSAELSAQQLPVLPPANGACCRDSCHARRQPPPPPAPAAHDTHQKPVQPTLGAPSPRRCATACLISSTAAGQSSLDSRWEACGRGGQQGRA